mgnify:FL=1|jgi:nucleotide-binding universal stress UspA family protein
MYKHILVPTDGSKLSTKAVKQAVAFAKTIGARITAVHVSDEYRAVMDEGFVLPAFATLKKRFEEMNVQRSNAVLKQVKAAAEAAGVACQSVAVTNNLPYDAIIQQAKKHKCDLIMMASHGRVRRQPV